MLASCSVYSFTIPRTNTTGNALLNIALSLQIKINNKYDDNKTSFLDVYSEAFQNVNRNVLYSEQMSELN